ncbi:hypothetical protein HHI36_012884 [Cryptolaemus montrouzieri]|uniref:Anoctamin dimerisation domain-containing protein n=1 Tax=Cryptolaemus montrouzieri TaxID=559131 RepID=A0ABD2NG78_9CUCU
MKYHLIRAIKKEKIPIKDNNVKFLKIHVPHEVLEEFADLHNIELSYKSKSPRLRKIIPWLPCIYTDLSLAGPDSELYKRAKYVPVNS